MVPQTGTRTLPDRLYQSLVRRVHPTLCHDIPRRYGELSAAAFALEDATGLVLVNRDAAALGAERLAFRVGPSELNSKVFHSLCCLIARNIGGEDIGAAVDTGLVVEESDLGSVAITEVVPVSNLSEYVDCNPSG
jgi:hypothetical protein